ncbi:MAG TPA: galactosyldiacylglycerol synthase [Anaerolineae bacterium]|nr:galactosyldiacylglycerol synthase [Anaerolineae bacterium]
MDMIALYDAASGAKVGRISEKQLEALLGWMEEESTEDREYYLTAEDCELMVEQGIDPTLVEVLREALKGREDMDLRYAQE